MEDSGEGGSLTPACVFRQLGVNSWPALNEGFAYPAEKVSSRDAGSSALDFFCRRHRASGSADEWARRIRGGQVTRAATGEPLAPDTLLKAGDALVYSRPPWAEPAAPSWCEVLFEDEHVLALAKPAGLQVLPKGAFCQRTVLGLLQLHQSARLARFPGSLLPTPVHRLGRGTSGVLLCACTAAARQALTRDFSASTELGAAAAAGSAGAGVAGRPLGKTYRALASGIIQQDEGAVDAAIGAVDYPGLSGGLFAASAAGKPALSLYRVLRRHASSTLVGVTILTGRPHQIRIHMAALGHPLVGDPLYGAGGLPLPGLIGGGRGAYGDAEVAMPGDCGYSLHSMDLRFRHPATGQQLLVTAPLPEALRLPGEPAGGGCRAWPDRGGDAT